MCLFLRDVAESLRLQGLPPLPERAGERWKDKRDRDLWRRQAEVAFDWVVRQLLLRADRDEGLVPPEYALRAGTGTAEERALLFLALLRQLDLDGCMVGIPGEGSAEPCPARKARGWPLSARCALSRSC
jgi:hypothetical protein